MNVESWAMWEKSERIPRVLDAVISAYAAVSAGPLVSKRIAVTCCIPRIKLTASLFSCILILDHETSYAVSSRQTESRPKSSRIARVR